MAIGMSLGTAVGMYMGRGQYAVSLALGTALGMAIGGSIKK